MRAFVKLVVENDFLWPDMIRSMFVWLSENPTMTEMNQAMQSYLQDPYTRVTERVDYASAFKRCGIGVRFALRTGGSATVSNAVRTSINGYPLIEQVVPGSPAAQKGITPGSSLVSIYSFSSQWLDLEMLSKLLLGEEGSPVTITVRLEESEELASIDLERAPVQYPLLNVNHNHGVCYIRPEPEAMAVEQFAAELRAALLGAQETTVGRILDLRDFEGGLTSSAIEMVEELCPTMKPTPLFTVRRRGFEETCYSRKPAPGVVSQPLVILVNEMTRSGGEIGSAVLQRLGVAYLIGTQTNGKWTMQNKYNFERSTGELLSLFVTVATVHLPDGRCLGDGHRNRPGVEPDQIVPQLNPAARPGTDADMQYMCAVHYVRQKASFAP